MKSKKNFILYMCIIVSLVSVLFTTTYNKNVEIAMTVPDLRGMTYQEAVDVLKQFDLKMIEP